MRILHKETRHSPNSASKIQNQIILMFRALKKTQQSHQQLNGGLPAEDTTAICNTFSPFLFFFFSLKENAPMSEEIASRYVATSYTDG